MLSSLNATIWSLYLFLVRGTCCWALMTSQWPMRELFLFELVRGYLSGSWSAKSMRFFTKAGFFWFHSIKPWRLDTLDSPISVGYSNSLLVMRINVVPITFNPCQISSLKLLWAKLIVFLGNQCGWLFCLCYFCPWSNIQGVCWNSSGRPRVLGPYYFHLD